MENRMNKKKRQIAIIRISLRYAEKNIFLALCHNVSHICTTQSHSWQSVSVRHFYSLLITFPCIPHYRLILRFLCFKTFSRGSSETLYQIQSIDFVFAVLKKPAQSRITEHAELHVKCFNSLLSNFWFNFDCVVQQTLSQKTDIQF